MLGFKKNFSSHKLKVFSFQEYSKKIIYCDLPSPDIQDFKAIPEMQSYSKTNKIQELISNIYVYKFPPILNWPDGLYIDIPVDFIIAIRKIFEHSSEQILANIKELCFSLNTDYSSYGDKIIIIPLEYITGDYDKNLFLDTVAHELGHVLAEELFKDKKIQKQVQSWHKVIKYYSLKNNENLFYDPKISEFQLDKYQLEDYREFLSELYSQILNYFDDLTQHVCKIEHDDAQMAYLNAIDLLMNYVMPFSSRERLELIENL
ncbi:MAG: hypothetical protein ACD_20C00213G0002 [uncultured bacterium]|nr:MAG: hypothetical protein ACD_20C00213G0002 [uncultured bacterium]